MKIFYGIMFAVLLLCAVCTGQETITPQIQPTVPETASQVQPIITDTTALRNPDGTEERAARRRKMQLPDESTVTFVPGKGWVSSPAAAQKSSNAGSSRKPAGAQEPSNSGFPQVSTQSVKPQVDSDSEAPVWRTVPKKTARTRESSSDHSRNAQKSRTGKNASKGAKSSKHR